MTDKPSLVERLGDTVLIRNAKGFSLLEVLISLAIIGIVCAGFLGGMTNALKGAKTIDRIDTARSLAEGQIEYIKKQPFAATYTPDSTMVTATGSPPVYNYDDFPGYSAAITAVVAAQRDANIQKVTVTIKYNGVTATTLDGCKVK
jgi:prepilin-type N-terminal cleavage/methylation domain-containing protein